MKSAKPKVLHEIAGRSLLAHAVAAAQQLDPRAITVVVRHDRDAVAGHALELDPGIIIADQDEVPGTGRAAQAAMAALDGAFASAAAGQGQAEGPVVITASDVPLLDGATLAGVLEQHRASGAAVTLLSTLLDNPTGYGRVVRAADGSVTGIVEEKDATDEQRAIKEINASIYVVDADILRAGLATLTKSAVTGELYLTDIVGYANKAGLSVNGVIIPDPLTVEGCNDKATLAKLGAELNRRLINKWMLSGVNVIDPATTWVDVTVELAPDVTLEPGVQLRGDTSVAKNATVGPDSTLTDVSVGEGASVTRTHATGAVIGAHAEVGPFTYLRPGTVLGEKGKIGAYCETKNANIGANSKVPHLSYAGDVTIGTGANLGAGTIIANYDGVNKHKTKIGNEVRIGSDSIIVAPVSIGDGAYTAAGSVITEDLPAGALGVGRAHQHNSPGWTAKRRAGTPAAQAASAATKATTS
jgi:bifunctional UDP-N-acetylglucosamine pyrophosphorylase/glucosamine-1-phosphate N-acetyltransferase